MAPAAVAFEAGENWNDVVGKADRDALTKTLHRDGEGSSGNSISSGGNGRGAIAVSSHESARIDINDALWQDSVFRGMSHIMICPDGRFRSQDKLMRGVRADELDWLGLAPSEGKCGDRCGFIGSLILLGCGEDYCGKDATGQDG